MNKDSLTSKIIEKMKENKFIPEDLMQNVDINESLTSYYRMDSMSIIQLIVMLETEFDIEFNETELTLENYESISTVINVIEKHLIH